jgi:hypothetical protein
MRKLTYIELLRDPRWQRRRLEVLGKADFKCHNCQSAEKTLHVHHKLYRKGAMPWEYEDHELICLCEECHEVDHRFRNALNEALAILDQRSIEIIVGYAEAKAAQINSPETIRVRSWYHGLGISIGFAIRDSDGVGQICDHAPEAGICNHDEISLKRLYALRPRAPDATR